MTLDSEAISLKSDLEMDSKISADALSHSVCQLQSTSAHYPATSQNAFAVVTQSTLPRAYQLGFESFLKNNPNTTLYIYGNLNAIDPRFAAHHLRVVMVPLNLTDLQLQLLDALPELDDAVFRTSTWAAQLWPAIERSPMILSDFVRLAVLYLHGGSWLDADALYLRPFTMRNGLPCHDRVTVGHGHRWVQCDADHDIQQPFNDSLPFIAGRTWYCTNGILGQFDRHHPFLRKALLGMARAYPDVEADPGLGDVAMGGHLLVETLLSTATESETRLQRSEWPLLYDINQMFGFWDVDEYLDQRGRDTQSMLRDLSDRNVFSVQLTHWVSDYSNKMSEYFSPGHLHYELWRRNCVFSCDDPIE